MSDDTIMYWEGVPVSELSREELEDALKTMHHLQEQTMMELASRRDIFRRRKMDRMGR